MADHNGRNELSVAQRFYEEGYRFDFFQAVRLLERLYPERQPIGHSASPAEEVVRLRARLSLSFPPSAIHEITQAPDAVQTAQMTVAFMGLTGPLGVLPRHYTDLLLERGRRKDWTLRDFLDIFNHRLISLFYRAWEKYRLPIVYEAAAWRHQENDCGSQYLFDLMGLGTTGLRGRMDVADKGLLFYTGLLAQHPHSASALVGFLQDYFGVPADVVQFMGQWLFLAPESRSRLGPGETQNALGVSAVAGARVWDQQAKFRIRLGPLTFAQFCQFLPTGSAFRQLVQLSRFFAGQEQDFDVQLVLQASDVPYCRLGLRSEGAPRLGWSAWLKTREFTHDATDAIFASEIAPAVSLSYQEKGESKAGATLRSAEPWHGGRGHEREPEVSDRETE